MQGSREQILMWHSNTSIRRGRGGFSGYLTKFPLCLIYACLVSSLRPLSDAWFHHLKPSHVQCYIIPTFRPGARLCHTKLPALPTGST
ncbi:hypothetical protein H9L39_03610 [Fusarium oxysporum f. sp. albedinis]|nr:hypothetical protein H9L39_03610 [Fusarium oxysporum f. sp. albedinis]